MTRIVSGRGDVMGALYDGIGAVMREGRHLDASPGDLPLAFLKGADAIRGAPRKAMVKAAVRATARILVLTIAAYINDHDQLQP